MIVILNNIRSKHNVGSIFRTADAIGAEKIYLTGYTPSPIDRYGREVRALTKVSLGAEKSTEWSELQKIEEIISELKAKNNQIIALEQHKSSVPYYKFRVGGDLLGKIAIILGSEVGGIDKNILQMADKIIEIPMLGKKESLNVSVAFGIIAFSLKYSNI